MRHQRRLSWFVFALSLVLALPLQAQVLISQVYGGGGNSGAQYKNDFIELFNAGSSPVDLTGWSVQYASSAGTTWQITPVSGTLQPGQYLLVQQAAGANTLATPLPTPDNTGTISMSGTAGKVALHNAITALSGACPVAQNLVAFGTAANCPPTTATLSNTTAALRKGSGCTNSNDNSADFSVLAPAPRNRSTTFNPCDGGGLPTDPTAIASVTPSSVQAGESVLLRVTVTPGQNPSSTGIVVIANLSSIGGSAAQALFDDGSNGDVLAGDRTFSIAITVDGATAPGPKLIGIGVGDDQLRSASLTASMSVVPLLAINQLQGSGLLSPYNGQSVIVEGIVTARKSNGFFLQTAEGEEDASSATSEGLLVFTSSAPPATASIGNRVRVLGLVAEFKSSSNPHQLTVTEITGPSLTIISTGNALPAAKEITLALANPSSPVDALERLEGMRVSVASLNVVAPVAAFITESTAASPPSGVFFGVLPGVARPFREPGVGALDTTVFPGGINPPVFDTNPERIRVQSTGQSGATALGADVGDVINGLVGVLDYSNANYSLLPDPSASVSVIAGATPTAVSVKKSSEITIGGFNLQRFFDETNAPGISDPVLTPAALANRLKKTANAICGYVRSPDILGVIEVENLDILQRLAAGINAGNTQDPGSCASNPQYTAHLEEGNDVGGIDVGFLVTGVEVAPGVPRVQILEIIQEGKSATLTNPNGTTSLLNDRPSLTLRVRINQANGAHYEVTVINSHLRSLSGVNSTDPGSDGWPTDGARIRAKRAAQAKYLADLVHARQLANPSERIVLLGDFNAFEFNDGYTDSMGIITGREAGPSQVLNYVDSPITTPLTNLAELSPEADRYSYSFDGNAQSLDHMVVNQALLDSTTGVRAEHARINADFGEDNYGDFTVPVRVSDHDPVVLFLDDAAFATADLAATVVASNASVVIGENVGFGVGVANGGPDAAAPASLELRLDVRSAGMTVQPANGWTCNAPVLDATGTDVHCSTASFAAGASGSFVIVVPTSREFGGRSLSLGARINSPMTDLAPTNNSSSDATQVTASADLFARVFAPKGPLNSKKLAVFGVGIANAGPHDAHNAVLMIAVNAPKSAVTDITDGTGNGLACSNASDSPTLSTWNCPAGEWYAAGRFDGLAVTVNPYFAQPSKVLSVGASFNSGTTDPALGNNSAAQAVKVVGATATLQ